jgi:hypothetical protein
MGGNGDTFSVMAAKIITDLYLGRPNPDADISRFDSRIISRHGFASQQVLPL